MTMTKLLIVAFITTFAGCSSEIRRAPAPPVSKKLELGVGGCSAKPEPAPAPVAPPPALIASGSCALEN
jgi:hypothetical protein